MARHGEVREECEEDTGPIHAPLRESLLVLMNLSTAGTTGHEVSANSRERAH